MEKKKLIIDTDCGSDDAVAIAMALRDERYEILCFTTVTGNVDARQAAVNTLTTIEMAGAYEPPVYIGCELPLLIPFKGAQDTHGDDGMGDIGLVPKRLKVAGGNGVLKLIETVGAHGDGEIEIITLGTLTNLALAIRLAPETMKKVKRISIMGSSGLGPGNMSAVAEFNIWQDAAAAKIVLESGIPILLVGWDACCGDAMLDENEIARLRASGPLGEFCVDCNKVLTGLNVDRFGAPCLDMADPSAVAAALEPDCIEICGDYPCEVDVNDGPSYGAVLVDVINFENKKPNVSLCTKLYPDKFKDYMFRTLGC